MKRSKSELTGIILMIQASLAFSVMALCVKFASYSLPSLEIVFFRSLIGSLMLLSVMLGKRISLLGRERRVMTLRGLSGFIALTLHFYTIARLPLGTAVMLNYTAPIFAAILAILFLEERPSMMLLAMILLAFTGVYLLVEVRLSAWNWNVFLGILSAIFAAIAYVSIRAVKHRESPYTIIFFSRAFRRWARFFFFPSVSNGPGCRPGWLCSGSE